MRTYLSLHFYRKASAEAAAWCQEQGHDITDISVLWSLAMEQIPTTLISTANPVNMARYRNEYFVLSLNFHLLPHWSKQTDNSIFWTLLTFYVFIVFSELRLENVGQSRL